MPEYVHEFGKRWNATTPRNAIKRYVLKQHVGTPIEDIHSEIETRWNAKGHPKRLLNQAKAYAAICHQQNLDLYLRVQRGF